MAVTVKHTFVSGIADDPKAAAAGEVLPSHWNADHTVSGIRTVMLADMDFYVSSTGSNSNDGLTPATAQATLAHMAATIANNYDGGGFGITINVAAGTYVGANIVFPPNYAFYSVLGAGLASTTLQDSGAGYCLGPNLMTGTFVFGAMTIDANNVNTVGFQPQGLGVTVLGDSTFSGSNPVEFTASGGQGGEAIFLGSQGPNTFQSPADFTISGTWQAAIDVNVQGNIGNPGFGNVILSGTPVWLQGYVLAFGGQMEMDGNFAGSGSIGPAFACPEPSIINFNVPNNLPGNSFGVFVGQLGYYDGNVRLNTVNFGRRVKTQTGDYQLVPDDRDARIEVNATSASTINIPSNAMIGGAGWIIGTEIRVTQIGTGVTSIAASSSVTLHNGGALSGQWATSVIYNRALNEWVQTSA